jgi:hypothetical protein
MTGVPKTTNDLFECHSCLEQLTGYSKRELLDEGWRWHDAGRDRVFVCCGVCEARFAARRRAAA